MSHHLSVHVSNNVICFCFIFIYFFVCFLGLLDQREKHYRTQGLWVVMGLLSFLLLEKMFPDEDSASESSAINRANNVSLPCATILHGYKILFQNVDGFSNMIGQKVLMSMADSHNSYCMANKHIF